MDQEEKLLRELHTAVQRDDTAYVVDVEQRLSHLGDLVRQRDRPAVERGERVRRATWLGDMPSLPNHPCQLPAR